jgi:hypothetical protein
MGTLEVLPTRAMDIYRVTTLEEMEQLEILKTRAWVDHVMMLEDMVKLETLWTHVKATTRVEF